MHRLGLRINMKQDGYFKVRHFAQLMYMCRLPAETDICAIFGGHLKT